MVPKPFYFFCFFRVHFADDVENNTSLRSAKRTRYTISNISGSFGTLECCIESLSGKKHSLKRRGNTTTCWPLRCDTSCAAQQQAHIHCLFCVVILSNICVQTQASNYFLVTLFSHSRWYFLYSAL